jgi:hypothetical protein|tara:strand:- start:5582 stop:5707 length:126 start_codon:yes stop_codon:yes gene_type:complete
MLYVVIRITDDDADRAVAAIFGHVWVDDARPIVGCGFSRFR